MNPNRARLRPAVLLACLVLLNLAVLALPRPAAAQGYGAIAFSPQTGQWGWSRNYRTRYQAANVAMTNCQSAAPRGCRMVVEVRGACASLAIGQVGWGAGWGTSQARANSEAMGACRQNSRGCTTRVQFCSR